MVTNQTLNRTFAALADDTRRDLLARLSRGEATVGELAEPYEISRPAISRHLRVLEEAGLVIRTPEGRMTRCRLDAEPIRAAAAWVHQYERFWEGQLESLARYFESDRSGESPDRSDTA